MQPRHSRPYHPAPSKNNESQVFTSMTEKFQGLYDIRFGTEEDNNFILATFLQGLYYGDSWFSLIPKAIFMANYKKVAQTLVTPGKTLIYVACLKDDPSVIIGYSVLSLTAQTVHW